MSRIKSFRGDYEKVLNSTGSIYRQRQKDIDHYRKMAQFDMLFPLRGVAAKYIVPFETLRGCIHRYLKTYEDHTGSPRLTPE